jgi:hypothetical protein
MLLLPGKGNKKTEWSNAHPAAHHGTAHTTIQEKLLVYQPTLKEVFEPLFSSF